MKNDGHGPFEIVTGVGAAARAVDQPTLVPRQCSNVSLAKAAKYKRETELSRTWNIIFAPNTRTSQGQNDTYTTHGTVKREKRASSTAPYLFRSKPLTLPSLDSFTDINGNEDKWFGGQIDWITNGLE